MYIQGLLRISSALGLASILALSGGTAADAQQRFKWKMASAYTDQLDTLGPNGPRIAKNLKAVTGGGLDIKWFSPGALLPALEIFDALSKGSVESAYTTPGFHVGKIPSLAFFASVPFGPQLPEYLGWLREGGGQEIWRELYAKHNLIGWHCGAVVAEASGWFKKPINSTEDLRGLKMRFFGLGAKVMTKMGVSTQLIAPADIYPALERGVIDATELSFPSIDLKFGYHQIAKHYYFPGWHQQSSLVTFEANLGKYNELPEQYKVAIEMVCGEAMIDTMAIGESKQSKALAEIKSKGVTVHRWPDSTLAVLSQKWDEVVAEESAKDATFKRVYESYANFRKEFAVWKDHGYLK